jgi:hypothetical protein
MSGPSNKCAQKTQGMAYANLKHIEAKRCFVVGKDFGLGRAPEASGSGYLLQVLAALRAFRSYPSRVSAHGSVLINIKGAQSQEYKNPFWLAEAYVQDHPR